MMPRTAPARVVPDRDHVAAVAEGDVALLERGQDGGVIEEPLDAEPGARRGASLIWRRSARRRGLARSVSRPSGSRALVGACRRRSGQAGRPARERGQRRARRPRSPAVGGQPGRGASVRPRSDQGGPSSAAPAGAARPGRPGIVRPVPGRRSFGRQGAARLASVPARRGRTAARSWRGRAPGARSRPGGRRREAAPAGYGRGASPARSSRISSDL